MSQAMLPDDFNSWCEVCDELENASLQKIREYYDDENNPIEKRENAKLLWLTESRFILKKHQQAFRPNLFKAFFEYSIKNIFKLFRAS